MRRFAKLTLEGRSVYVDPSLVGVVMPHANVQTRTLLMPRDATAADIHSQRWIAQCDEPPDEAYRRLAAAAETVTRAEYEAIGEELRAARWTAGSDLRARMMSSTNIDDFARAAIAPVQAIYDKLKKTTLAALWVAEGEEPPK